MNKPQSEILAFEAATKMCPERTVWVLGEDGYYHCHCCTDRARYEDLEDPVLISPRWD